MLASEFSQVLRQRGQLHIKRYEAAFVARGTGEMTIEEIPTAELKRTPLYDFHVASGAKMVPFAGYDMPVQYALGVMAEHNHTRAQAGLFDVSHMGQAFLIGRDHDSVAAALESLTPGNIMDLGPGRVRYSVLLSEDGGIIDDLMATRLASKQEDGRLFLIINADRKEIDANYISKNLPVGVSFELDETFALLALQGPKAAEILKQHCPQADALGFMMAASAEFDGFECHISRSGYTGEDGFEISMAQKQAEYFAQTLCAHNEVEPIGLGARDSLRLEAGLCLYGHDLDETISPVEAGLEWVIAKRRREQGGFPGAERILKELDEGPKRRRIGIKPLGRAPAREGTKIQAKSGEDIGHITSGGFGPSKGWPMAMGYVQADYAMPGTELDLIIRDKAHAAIVMDLPFVPHRYKRAVKKE